MTWRPCPCKRWGSCTGFESYALGEIIPCRVQVLYLVKGLVEFDHEDAPGSRRVRAHAAFVVLSDLWAEFNYRLERTGRDGETLVHEVRLLNVYEVNLLSESARDALWYVAGRERKILEYRKWRGQRQWRRNPQRTDGRAGSKAKDPLC